VRLYWKVFAINGLVLSVATLALVVGPVTVSRPTAASELVVLTTGLAVMLLANALLLRVDLNPIDRIIGEMGRLDPTYSQARVTSSTSEPGRRLADTFNNLLERLAEERASSHARTLAAQEAERQRIAQELHDEIGQHLTVVLLGLKRLEQGLPEALTDEVALLRLSVRAGLDDVRRVAHQLRPSVLTDLGLTNALAALTNDFERHHPAALRRTIAPGLPALSHEAELAIYRIGQEALTNAARHADPRHVDLSLVHSGAELILTVADDGSGFEPTKQHPGAGIRGMYDRAMAIRGDLTISSGIGEGTTLRLAVPLAAQGDT
jgi:two-component system, NarL family, sensor histidine kinase UhpB